MELPFQSEHCQYIAGPKKNFDVRNGLRRSAPDVFNTSKPSPIATPVVLFRNFSKLFGQPADLQKCNYKLRNDNPHVTFTALLTDLYSVIFWASLLTLRLLMSYIYGAPSKARNANVAYIWTYVWQR